MRASFLFAFVCLTVSVWAGGYQGALERVLLYYAYQIDALNDEKDQILGFRCKTTWDKKTGQCKGNEFQQCEGKALEPSTRCNFNELMVFLGKMPTSKPILVEPADDQNTRTPDIQGTYNIFNNAEKVVYNFPPWKAMKGGTDNYNDYIEALGDVLTRAKGRRDATNQALWDAFDNTTDAISTARIGDHGPHLITAAEKDLGTPHGIKIERTNLGTNPATGEIWETVDWEATREAARKQGITDIDTKIDNFNNHWYSTVKAARQHKGVLDAYNILESKAMLCH